MNAHLAGLMIKILGMATTLFLTFSGMNGAVAQTVNSGDLAKGQTIATQYCGRCHAVGLQGTSPHPKAPLFRKLSERWPIASLEESLAEGISVGHAAMPEFRFEIKEIDSLLVYLDRINRFEARSR